MPVLDKCPAHPEKSGESQYGGLWCKSQDCKWAVKEFINDTEDGGVEKVTKYHLPEPGKWLAKEGYILAVEDMPEPTSTPTEPPTDRDQLILRQTCVKAACAALALSGLNLEEKTGQIVSLATALEDWVTRD